jgi:hypothetical protein
MRMKMKTILDQDESWDEDEDESWDGDEDEDDTG